MTNRIFGVFPDEAFAVLVREGKARPASFGEIREWIAKAKREGNSEPAQHEEYMLAATYVLDENTELPNGMTEMHAKMFLMRDARKLPRNALKGQNVFLLGDGTCIGAVPGCAFL